MTHIWLDLWDKKVWVAVLVEWISVPKAIVVRTKIVSYIRQLIGEYQVTTIVVGLPYDLYGIQQKQLQKTQKFIEKLIEIFPEIRIIWYDERFSTMEAKRDSTTHQDVDDISASIILESYIHNT